MRDCLMQCCDRLPSPTAVLEPTCRGRLGRDALAAVAAARPRAIAGGGGGPLRSGAIGTGPVRSSHDPVYAGNGAPMQAFEATNYYFEQAANCLDLSENVRTLMITPDREVRVEVVIELDSGKIGNFIGYRVQHDNARGPIQGGLALPSHGRPGRSPVAGQPDDLEDGARRSAVRRRQGGDQLRSQQALARRAGAPDAEVHREDPRHDRAAQGHPRARHGNRRAGDGLDHERIRASTRGFTRPASRASRSSSTGRPAARPPPASAWRSSPASCSPGSSARSPGTTFAIQGYGNVGSHTARCLAQMGGKIIGVSDAYGAVVNPRGTRHRRARQARRASRTRSSASREATPSPTSSS